MWWGSWEGGREGGGISGANSFNQKILVIAIVFLCHRLIAVQRREIVKIEQVSWFLHELFRFMLSFFSTSR